MAEENKIIELRGHHLKNLCCKYFEDYAKADIDSYYGEGTGANIARAAFNEKAKIYGIDFAMDSENIYFHLVKTPKQLVKIIDDFDMVCKKCPSIKKEKCPNISSYDKEVADKFELRINREYEMLDIMNMFDLHKNEFLKENAKIFDNINLTD